MRSGKLQWILVMSVLLTAKAGAYDWLSQSDAAPDGNLVLETELEARWLTSSNIFASPSNQSDSYTETAATLRVKNDEDSRLFFDLAYNPTYRAYLRNSSLNNLDHEFSFESVYSSVKSSITFEADYTDARRTDRVLGSNVALKRFASNVAFQTEINPKWDIAASYGYTLFDYENIFESLRHDLDFEARHHPTEKLTLSTKLALNSSENDDIKSDGHEFSIASRYQPTPKTNVDITLAYKGQQTPSGSLSAYAADVSFSSELTPKTSITFSIYRSARLTSFDFWQTGYGARASALWQMTLKSSLQIAAEYENLDRIPLNGNSRTQHVNYHSISTTFRTQINDQSSVFASMTFDSQNSSNVSNTFDRQQFQIGYSYKF